MSGPLGASWLIIESIEFPKLASAALASTLSLSWQGLLATDWGPAVRLREGAAEGPSMPEGQMAGCVKGSSGSTWESGPILLRYKVQSFSNSGQQCNLHNHTNSGRALCLVELARALKPITSFGFGYDLEPTSITAYLETRLHPSSSVDKAGNVPPLLHIHMEMEYKISRLGLGSTTPSQR